MTPARWGHSTVYRDLGRVRSMASVCFAEKKEAYPIAFPKNVNCAALFSQFSSNASPARANSQSLQLRALRC
jgi:hypothetical protein